jgi:hypothetical protein
MPIITGDQPPYGGTGSTTLHHEGRVWVPVEDMAAAVERVLDLEGQVSRLQGRLLDQTREVQARDARLAMIGEALYGKIPAHRTGELGAAELARILSGPNWTSP